MIRFLAILAAAAAVTANQNQNIPFSFHQRTLTSQLDNYPNVDDASAVYQAEANFVRHRLAEDQLRGYMICHNKEGMSGYMRGEEIKAFFDVSDLGVIYNQEDATCFLTSVSEEVLKEVMSDISLSSLSSHDAVPIQVQPMTTLMKMRRRLMENVVNEKVRELDVMICPGSSSEDIMNDLVISTGDDDMKGDEENRYRKMMSGEDFPWAEQHDHIIHKYVRRVLLPNESSQSSITEEIEDETRSQIYPQSWLQAQLFTDDHHDRHLTMWRRALTIVSEDEAKQCASMFENMLVIDTLLGIIIRLYPDEEEKVVNSECLLAFIATLSARPEVCSVEATTGLELFNHIAQWTTQSHMPNYRPFWDKGITGKGVVVQVSDTGLDTNHCNFFDSTPGELKDNTIQLDRRKVVLYHNYADDTDVYDGHGTHVVGTIAGKNSVDGTIEGESLFDYNDDTEQLDGMARDAKIAFFDFQRASSQDLSIPFWDFDIMFGKAVSAGATMHNGSWGNDNSEYGWISAFFDLYMYQMNDSFLIVMGAGNQGASGVMEPSNAKNVIAVGASDANSASHDENANTVAYFSARGYSLDRIKPDIIAPGHAIQSTAARPDGSPGHCIGDPDNSQYFASGTSTAAPVVSGSIALVQQYLQDGFYPSGEANEDDAILNPSAALMKAIILNGALEMSNHMIDDQSLSSVMYDHNQGFGRISLIDTLPLKDVNTFHARLYDRMNISQGEEHHYDFEVEGYCEGIDVISVTLAYSDDFGWPGCISCLMNDIDLKIIVNGDVTYFPNGRNSPDSNNNVERIRISVDEGDSVRAIVTATNLAKQKSQTYALAITGCVDELMPSVPTTETPSLVPTYQPSSIPSLLPSFKPSVILPSTLPSPFPSNVPTQVPTDNLSTFIRWYRTGGVSNVCLLTLNEVEELEGLILNFIRSHPKSNGWDENYFAMSATIYNDQYDFEPRSLCGTQGIIKVYVKAHKIPDRSSAPPSMPPIEMSSRRIWVI